MPTGKPWISAKPHTSVVPYSALNSSNHERIDQARDDLAHIVGFARTLRNDSVELARIVGGLGRARRGKARGGGGRRRATARRANASACVSFSA